MSQNQMLLQIRSADNTVFGEFVAVSDLLLASEEHWISEVQKVCLVCTCTHPHSCFSWFSFAHHKGNAFTLMEAFAY